MPWYTYAAVQWLDQLDLSGLDVFEFGSGNSTVWWAERCRSLTSVEHDPDWYDRTVSKVPPSTDYLLISDPAEYVGACSSDYDVIIVDGVYRYDCAAQAVNHLRDGGLIIVDNGDWMWNTTAFLRDRGFTQVDFVGPGPINDYTWSTSAMLAPEPSRIPHKDRMRVIGGISQQGEGDSQTLVSRS